jgi:hypothetical protein
MFQHSGTTALKLSSKKYSGKALARGSRSAWTTPPTTTRTHTMTTWQGLTLVHFSAQPEPFLSMTD